MRSLFRFYLTRPQCHLLCLLILSLLYLTIPFRTASHWVVVHSPWLSFGGLDPNCASLWQSCPRGKLLCKVINQHSLLQPHHSFSKLLWAFPLWPLLHTGKNTKMVYKCVQHEFSLFKKFALLFWSAAKSFLRWVFEQKLIISCVKGRSVPRAVCVQLPYKLEKVQHWKAPQHWNMSRNNCSQH